MFDYRRHITASFVQALDIHDDEVLTREITSGEAEIFCAFLDDIDQGADLIMEIHLVMDDGSPHTVMATTRNGSKLICPLLFTARILSQLIQPSGSPTRVVLLDLSKQVDPRRQLHLTVGSP